MLAVIVVAGDGVGGHNDGDNDNDGDLSDLGDGDGCDRFPKFQFTLSETVKCVI